MRRLVAPAITTAVIAAGCSNSSSEAEDTDLVPVPTNSTTTTAYAAADTTAPTTSPSTTTSTVAPTSTNPRSGGPPPTPAPTTTTEPPVLDVELKVPTADPALLNQTQANPDDFRNNRPIEPEHVEVLETYLQGFDTSYLVYSTWPIDPDEPTLATSGLSNELIEAERQFLIDRLAARQVLNVEQGVTWRPYIVGPVEDTATVFDCGLAGHYWMYAETGEPVPPNEIWYGVPGEIKTVGLRTEMRQQDDNQWVIYDQQITPEACQ